MVVVEDDIGVVKMGVFNGEVVKVEGNPRVTEVARVWKRVV